MLHCLLAAFQIICQRLGPPVADIRETSFVQDKHIRLQANRCKDHLLFTCITAGKSKPQHASIPRWHFWMVLDTARNIAYELAIRQAIEALQLSGVQRVKVLDIGAGSGLLSLFAAR